MSTFEGTESVETRYLRYWGKISKGLDPVSSILWTSFTVLNGNRVEPAHGYNPGANFVKKFFITYACCK
jgi:hypothetical protein